MQERLKGGLRFVCLLAKLSYCTVSCTFSVLQSYSPSALGSSHLECCILVWSPQHRKDKDLLEHIQKRATKMIRELEHFSYEDMLRESGRVKSRDEKALERLYCSLLYL